MRLKSIKLAGFKSFVDPTTVNFPSNLSAVVGPNGCGKSNIIDAVRWVMGESSAKNLRGEAMTDVIFNGSNTRKPIGQASIELVFDNSDGKILGEYASYAEIAIRRKVTRDGQNLYYLNGNKCRRRDITDIFLGTGLGPRSYAIIEQGMISRLIEARPEDLRVYVEEAAGISKYKERRRETESRMRRTQENLERLTDIRDELERQLQRLERQAQSAEKYRELKQTERQLKAQLQGVRYRDIRQQSEQKHRAITELELQVEAAVTEQVNRDSGMETERARQSDLAERFNQVQARFYSVGADIARLEQTIKHVQERESQLQRDLEQTARDAAQAEELLQADTQKVEDWQAELLELEPELALLQEAEQSSAEQLLLAEEAMQAWQQDWDDFHQSAALPRQRAEVQQSRIQHLEQVQQRLLERLRKLEQEKQHLVVDEAEEQISEYAELLLEFEAQLEDRQRVLADCSDQLARQRAEEQRLSSELNQARQAYQSSKGRLASLEALQQAALNPTGDASNHWLKLNDLEQARRLAEQIQVEPGWEKAVEVVLGAGLQAVCVKSVDAYAESLAGQERGRLMLIDADALLPQLQPSVATLAGKVSAPLAVAPLLTGILAADNLTAALQIRRQLKPGESVVTRDGLWLGVNWLRLCKDEDSAGGVLARAKELEQVSLAQIRQAQEVESFEQALQQCVAALRDNEQQREEARIQAEAIVRKQSDVKSSHSALAAKVEQVVERRRRADAEARDTREQLALEAESLAEARAELEQAIEAMEQDTGMREQLTARRERLRDALDAIRQRARQDKDRVHELALRSQSIKTQLGAVQHALERLREQSTTLAARRQALYLALEESREPVEDQQLELEALLEQRLRVESQLTQARTELDATEQALRQSEKQRQATEQLLQRLRGDLERHRLEAQHLDTQAGGLRQQLVDDQFELQDVLATLAQDADERQLNQELEQIGARIARLGAINLAAIDEYKIESERKGYLDAQNHDLQEALETLENAIRKIDRETRNRFKETFDQINSGLQALFPKVFGGGSATLELTGEDLLDTGIAIMARPPGKRNSTIHLLSGGEKALTAIALVFSIFRLNPAPFCMLDEVDAPLDDANVGRYARMVEEMSSQVQFIYITHNKIAMEMAHQLMGVTMHEPGVSRIVTVDVEEAAELAAV